MSREWKPSEPVPERYSGMPVTFAWNDVALTSLLRALEKHYPSGHASMVDHVRAAMSTYTPPTPPKPEEPTGLGAVVEDDKGVRWVRAGRTIRTADDWRAIEGEQVGWWSTYADIAAVKVLSDGVTS